MGESGHCYGFSVSAAYASSLEIREIMVRTVTMKYRQWMWWALSGPSVFGAPVTFTRDIAPIIFKYCAPCHRPGEAAPFSLLTYEDAKKHATQIAAVTASRYMPPWPPEAGKGDFAGERRLSEAQIAAIAKWAASGAPQG